MDRAMNYLGLARKAGLAELGEEPVGAAARAGKAVLMLVASDASDHTWRRALSFAAGTDQVCVRLPYTKDDMGLAVGRQSLAIAAVTGAEMALALLQSLPQPERYGRESQILKAKAEKAIARRAEAKAHARNKRMGKVRTAGKKNG